MTGVVIVSLDCEGLWGLADTAPKWKGVITETSLKWAYQTVFETLDRWKISATMAYVSLFVQPKDAVLEQLDDLLESPARRRWLRYAAEDLRRSDFDGWHMDRVVELAALRGHEVSSHTYTHLPLASSDVTEEDVEYELASSIRSGTENGHPLSTMIFPRNQVPDLDLIVRYPEIRGYRAAPRGGGRLTLLAREMDIWARSSLLPAADATPCAIPGETFLNWRSGPRLVIPRSVTLRHWRSILDHAARTGGVAHLWLHPHNLVTGQRQAELLDACLSHIHRYTSSGRLLNLTQAGLVDLLRSKR